MYKSYKEKADFAVIGKPNNGKSSIISTLTFDDKIKIADEIGTTIKSSKYVYEYKGRIVSSYYDTPGFERAKDIWAYIKKYKEEIPSTNQILENFIQENQSKISFEKDIEILNAIVNSDFIIFIINVSQKFNKNIIGYELEILKELKQRVVILFNQIDEKKDYSSVWEDELENYKLRNIHKVEILNSSYENVVKILQSLYSMDLEVYNKQKLDDVIRSYKEHYNNNLDDSVNLISQYIKEALQTEVYTSREKYNQEYGLKLIKEKINEKEKNIQEKLSKIWGYYQVKVEDKRENYDHEINKTISLSKKEKALAVGSVGAIGVGTTTGVLSGGFGAPAGALMGFVGGAVLGYFSDGKLYESKLLKKDAKITVSSGDSDLSIILITRILEFIKTVINHGHANRNAVIVKNIEKRHFDKKEINSISEIHKSFVNDKNSDKYIGILKELILYTLKRELK